MATKTTNAEVEIRVNEVLELVIRGYSRRQIIRYGSKWNVSSRTIDDYLLRAKKAIQESYDDDYKQSLINVHLAQLDDLYVKNYKIEDYKECRSVIETKSKLLGIDAPMRIETSFDLNNVKTETLEDLFENNVLDQPKNELS